MPKLLNFAIIGIIALLAIQAMGEVTLHKDGSKYFKLDYETPPAEGYYKLKISLSLGSSPLSSGNYAVVACGDRGSDDYTPKEGDIIDAFGIQFSCGNPEGCNSQKDYGVSLLGSTMQYTKGEYIWSTVVTDASGLNKGYDETDGNGGKLATTRFELDTNWSSLIKIPVDAVSQYLKWFGQYNRPGAEISLNVNHAISQWTSKEMVVTVEDDSISGKDSTYSGGSGSPVDMAKDIGKSITMRYLKPEKDEVARVKFTANLGPDNALRYKKSAIVVCASIPEQGFISNKKERYPAFSFFIYCKQSLTCRDIKDYRFGLHASIVNYEDGIYEWQKATNDAYKESKGLDEDEEDEDGTVISVIYGFDTWMLKNIFLPSDDVAESFRWFTKYDEYFEDVETTEKLDLSGWHVRDLDATTKVSRLDKRGLSEANFITRSYVFVGIMMIMFSLMTVY